ncbi:MAG: GNAT family N-acetyltransferase [Kineosporiaceae bacterium]|nr:GNAT family N-acetyltransferase [Aeromicrobium sp.]
MEDVFLCRIYTESARLSRHYRLLQRDSKSGSRSSASSPPARIRQNGVVIPPTNIPVPVPDGWSATVPDEHDVLDLTQLLHSHETTAIGSSSASVEGVSADVCGKNEVACAHMMVRDANGAARGWASVHDRAAGRVLGAVTIDPELDQPTADDIAASLYAWTEQAAIHIGRERGLEQTQLDSGTFADDKRQQRWAQTAGLKHVRSWWQMARPVVPAEADDGVLPDPRDEVFVRQVRRGKDGLPVELDLRIVHDLLEASFADHFNSHRETFDEFIFRLRSDPGHRWDHWWIAEIADEGEADPKIREMLPAGTLVGTASEGDGDAPDGTYVSYLGVLQSSRGHGVAKALLHAVIADAAERGRNRVTLEVDVDSSTGADGLYLALGFEPKYTTQSWHKNLPVSS